MDRTLASRKNAIAPEARLGGDRVLSGGECPVHLPVPVLVMAIVVERPRQAVREGGAGAPAEEAPDFRDVRDEVSGLLCLPFRRERGEGPRRALEPRELLGELPEGRGSVVAHVQNLPPRALGGRGKKDRLDAVVDVEEVALNRPVAEDLERLSVEGARREILNVGDD